MSSLSSSPPSSSSSSSTILPLFLPIAQTLPPEVRLAIIESTALLSHDTAEQHGGTLSSIDPTVRWSSHESLAPLCLICKSWNPQGTFVLYRSVGIFSLSDAKAFNAAIEGNRRLANHVKEMVVGCLDEQDAVGDQGVFMDASEEMVKAVRSCPRLRKLHVLPLHASARLPLLDAVATRKALQVLVCEPRVAPSDPMWAGPFFRTDDLAHVSASLRYLEVDAWSSRDAYSPLFFLLHPIPTSNNLRTLKFRADSGIEAFSLLLAGCTSLTTLHFYTERPAPPEALVPALKTVAGTLVNLSWISNLHLLALAPSEPLFTTSLLSRFTSLESLAITSTEVAPNVFRHLPPQVKTFCLHSLANFEASYAVAVDMVERVQEGEAVGVERVVVEDTSREWGWESIDLMKEVFAARGIDFEFKESPIDPLSYATP